MLGIILSAVALVGLYLYMFFKLRKEKPKR